MIDSHPLADLTIGPQNRSTTRGSATGPLLWRRVIVSEPEGRPATLPPCGGLAVLLIWAAVPSSATAQTGALGYIALLPLASGVRAFEPEARSI